MDMYQRLVFLFLFIAIPLFAKQVPPDSGVEAITVPATLKDDIFKSIKLGGKTIIFEHTTLSDIKNTIGFGEITKSIADGSSQYSLCYSTEHETIWFISHGGMGGSDHSLTQLHAISKNLKCPTLNLAIETNFGWLNMDTSSIKKHAGLPSGISNNMFKYFYEGETQIKHGNVLYDYIVFGYAEIKFTHNKASTIYVSHVTSS
jgi:hypothetical protein